MEERPRKERTEDTPHRMDALENGLAHVQGRLDSVERSTRSMEKELYVMKNQLLGMEAGMQEMLMIFRGLSEKLKRQAETRAADPMRRGAGPVQRTPAGPREEARDEEEEWVRRRRRQEMGKGDELTRDPRHRQEDDEG
jgi:hypothetical protein